MLVGERIAAASAARARLPGIPAKVIILALVAVIVIPGIFFASFLLFRYSQAERGRYELQSISVASSAAAVIDAELIGLQRTLQAISVSQFLSSDDFASFYGQAMAVKALTGADIGLRQLNGQQIVNTRVKPG